MKANSPQFGRMTLKKEMDEADGMENSRPAPEQERRCFVSMLSSETIGNKTQCGGIRTWRYRHMNRITPTANRLAVPHHPKTAATIVWILDNERNRL